MRRTVKPPCFSSASTTWSAPSCSTTPAITGSAPRDRNAIPSAIVMMTGNANTQNTASGSRTNSRNRDSVNSTSGRVLFIAQLPSGQRHEHILERRAVRAELAQRLVAIAQRIEQRRQREMHLRRRQVRDGLVIAD